MKTALTFAAAGTLAVALLHCSADGAPSDSLAVPPSSLDAASDVEAADASLDAPSDDTDATLDADTDAGVCSPDGWCRVALPQKDLDLQALWSFGPNDAYAVGASGMVHWDGTAWAVVDAPDAGLEGLTSLWASGPNDLWGIAANQRRLVHGSRPSPTATFTWSQTSYDDGPTFTTLRGLGTRDLWILGSFNFNSVFLHAALPDDGSAAPLTWNTVPIGYDYFYASSFAVTENNELWATGFTSAAVVIHASPTEPGKDTYVWDQDLDTTGQPYAYFIGLWAQGTNDIWAIGTPGWSYHRGAATGGTASWKPVENHANLNAASVWGSASNDIWTVGESGAVRHWDGSSWSVSRLAVNGTPNYAKLTAIHGSSASDVWAVGPGMALHHTGASK